MGVFDERGEERVDRTVAGYPRLGGLSGTRGVGAQDTP